MPTGNEVNSKLPESSVVAARSNEVSWLLIMTNALTAGWPAGSTTLPCSSAVFCAHPGTEKNKKNVRSAISLLTG